MAWKSLLIAYLFICGSSAQYWADFFNRDAASPENKPDEIISALGLKPGMGVADLGAGGGYFTLRFARAVGKEGKVYAVDIREDLLEIIRDAVSKSRLDNVVYVCAREDDSMLPEGSADLIFVRNVFHHLPDQEKYFRNIRPKLRPGGRIAIIEYKKGSYYAGHETPEETVIASMKKAGYALWKRYHFLEKQSFTIFIPAESR
jgi:ubiquinone/menaquinone biosynthesis C-methylase UbiE